MTNGVAKRPIHIPKDAYADVNFLRAVCLCGDWLTTREVDERMAQLVPERSHLSGELEVQRDRLDFATYAGLLEKRERPEEGRERQYRLAERGLRLCTGVRDGGLTSDGLRTLQSAILHYSTANEASAAHEYRGHSARPFLLSLRLLDEIGRRPDGTQILQGGVPKRVLADCVCGLWTEDEGALAEATNRAVRWAADADQYAVELDQYIHEHYGLDQETYHKVTTNNPARLGEWLSKLGLLTVSPSGEVYNWNQNRDREARELRSLYGLSDVGRRRLDEMGLRRWPLAERETRRRRYVTGEESKEHILLKKLVINFAEDRAVIGEELTLVAEEYVYPTGDRADLILRDAQDRLVAIEVEVDVGPEDIPGVLQAAKYREMLAIMHGLHRDEVRAMLIAFSVAHDQRSLARHYGIEVYEVDQSLRDLVNTIPSDEW